MPAATFEIAQQIRGLSQPQQSRKKQLEWLLDFNTLGDGTGIAATESADFGIIPAGFIYEDFIAILMTAEGATATVDFGIDGDVDGFLDGGNANGTINATIAKAGNESIARGTYFHTNTPIRVTGPAAAATLDDAIIYVVLLGTMIEKVQ